MQKNVKSILQNDLLQGIFEWVLLSDIDNINANLTSLATTCKQFDEILNDPMFWRHLLRSCPPSFALDNDTLHQIIQSNTLYSYRHLASCILHLSTITPPSREHWGHLGKAFCHSTEFAF